MITFNGKSRVTISVHFNGTPEKSHVKLDGFCTNYTFGSSIPPKFLSTTSHIFFFFNFALRYHKNQTTQQPGWNKNILQWCLKEAKENHLKPQDFMGGFVLDEKKVQVTK